MDKVIYVINEAQALVDEIIKNAEGLDPVILLEALCVTDGDFTEAMDAGDFIESLNRDGLL